MRKMKTAILILGLSVFFSVEVYSQQFNGGVMAGIVGSQVAGDTFTGFDKAGIFAGGFVNYQFTKRSILQMDLEYFQKGSRRNPNPKKNEYTEYLFRTNYIELPVLYQFAINDRFKVEAGPSAGFLVGYYETRDGEDLTGRPDYNKPASVTLQINFGLYIGIIEGLKVNIRTNNSLINIRSHNAPGDVYRFFPGNYGQFNDCLVLSLWYQFRNKSEK
jgi:hypothetical protein